MTIYITENGNKLTANSATELVEQLQQILLVSSENLPDFMQQVAQKFQTERQIALITTDPEAFIASLIRNDYLSVIDAIDG